MTTNKKPGRPKTMENGTRTHIYMTPVMLAIAKQLGEGNASRGIRLALESFLPQESKSPCTSK